MLAIDSLACKEVKDDEVETTEAGILSVSDCWTLVADIAPLKLTSEPTSAEESPTGISPNPASKLIESKNVTLLTTAEMHTRLTTVKVNWRFDHLARIFLVFTL